MTSKRRERPVLTSKWTKTRARVLHAIDPALNKWPLLAIVLTGALLLVASSVGLRRVSAVSIVSLGTPVTQNFDTLATSGTANAWADDTTLPGWYSQFELTATNPTTYRADAGASNTGAIYSWGTGTGTERAFGSVASGTPGTIFNALKLTNNTGSTITSLDISYIGEQWRNGGNVAAQKLDFQYQTASPGGITDSNTPSTGWTDFDSLDFVSPTTGAAAAALDGNAAANRTAKSANLVVTVIPGQEIWLRWKDINDAGNDHGLAVDDLSVTANGGTGTPVLNIGDVNQAEGNALTTSFTFNVSLTVAAGAGGVTFTVNTADGTTNPANAGSDYSAIVNGAGTILQGNTSTTVNVTVNGDTTPEPNETFFVNISNITGANAGDVQGLGTISNDDFAATPIHTIQGSGNTSPFAGQVVTTTGIVTGVKTNGFFIQEPVADGDPNTSEGIFVFTSSAPPAAAALGNAVAVSGTVQEFIPSADLNSPPLTEIAGSPTVTLLSTGNPLPAAITLTAADTSPAGTIEQLEKFEGMRVHVNSLTAVAPTQGSITESSATSVSNGVFYGVITGVARPFREPGVEVPDPLPVGSPCCVPRFDANPERLRVDSDGLVGAAQLEVSSGATIANVSGPLDYAFRTYTILPDPGTLTQASVVGNISAIPVPVLLANEFTVASANLERFYDTVDDPGGDVVLTATAFNNRLNKASLAIRNVMRSPDIIGVEEMENLTTLQTLATKINNDTVAGGGANPNYQAYLSEGNDVGGIDVGFLVKASRVTVIDVTQFGLTTMYTEPGGAMALLNDRPPLVLRATVNAPNATLASFPITVIVNHLRSLNGVDDPTDGPRVRAKRKAQAEFLANLIQPRQATENIVSVGDYNAFEFSDGYVDVIGTIKGTPAPATEVVLASSDLVNPDLTDLIAFATPDQKYSYSFDGNAQTLDHELITANLLSRFAHINYARNDADFPDSLRNDPNRPERITDHDLPVAFFTFPVACVITCPSNITRSNDLNQCGAIVTYSPSSTGDCGTITCSPASSSFFPVGTTTVTCTSGTAPSCSFSVTVNDTQAPSITCPANIIRPTDSNQCTAVVTYPAPTVSDNCPGTSAPKGKLGPAPLTPVCTPVSGSTFPTGVTTVNCTVSDAAGNPSACSFTVTVNDSQLPVITCPGNTTRPTDPNQCTAVVGFAPVASDNCSSGAALVQACSPPSGSAFPKGTTNVLCTATDASGNQASCLFTVTVNDTQPPTFVNGCLANIYTAAAASCPITTNKVISYTYPAATDNCPGVTVTCNPPTGSAFPPGTTTVNCTATDSSGNFATCSFQVSVFSACLVDETNPGNVVLFNATTGDYRYCCNGVLVASGRGKLNIRGCSLTIDESNGDRRVRITADTTANSGAGAGTAFFQRLGVQTCLITDRSMVGNNCTCN